MQTDQREVAKYLYEQKADINALCSPWKCTALQAAIEKENQPMLKWLLEIKADPEKSNSVRERERFETKYVFLLW